MSTVAFRVCVGWLCLCSAHKFNLLSGNFRFQYQYQYLCICTPVFMGNQMGIRFYWARYQHSGVWARFVAEAHSSSTDTTISYVHIYVYTRGNVCNVCKSPGLQATRERVCKCIDAQFLRSSRCYVCCARRPWLLGYRWHACWRALRSEVRWNS